MSERSSFVTEFVYCDRCFAAVKDVLLGRDKYLCSIVVPPWDGCARSELPIVAGKIGGLGAGEELLDLELKYGPALAKRICHPLRIAVLLDSGASAVLRLAPGADVMVDMIAKEGA
jgi:hypothetical protein